MCEGMKKTRGPQRGSRVFGCAGSQRNASEGGVVIAQMRATPDFRAASATALATVGPTRGSNAFGMM